MQSLSIDVAKLKCIVRVADMMLCGAAVGMLMDGVTGLQTRLASQAPLLVEPGFSHDGVQFQPEGAHMLKVCCLCTCGVWHLMWIKPESATLSCVALSSLRPAQAHGRILVCHMSYLSCVSASCVQQVEGN